MDGRALTRTDRGIDSSILDVHLLFPGFRPSLSLTQWSSDIP